MKNNTVKLTALGSTSALALIAAATNAQALDFYAGLSAGVAFGDIPAPGTTSNPEDYSLSGAVLGGFAGVKSTLNNGMMIGFELALSGPTEGDSDENSSYDYAYDVNWTLDSKLRVGTNIGNIMVYGFGGFTFGNANNYWVQNGYSFSGTNIGIGAEMELANGMTVGIEGIQRNLSGYGGSSNDASNQSSQAISARVGFTF